MEGTAFQHHNMQNFISITYNHLHRMVLNNFKRSLEPKQRRQQRNSSLTSQAESAERTCSLHGACPDKLNHKRLFLISVDPCHSSSSSADIYLTQKYRSIPLRIRRQNLANLENPQPTTIHRYLEMKPFLQNLRPTSCYSMDEIKMKHNA